MFEVLYMYLTRSSQAWYSAPKLLVWTALYIVMFFGQLDEKDRGKQSGEVQDIEQEATVS